jgi:hypothetical protein
VPATCGTLDTLQVAVTSGGGASSAEFRNVTVDGAAVGDLLDNADGVAENHFWTFEGEFADGVTVTGQLVVAGWDQEESPRPRIEVAVGCGQ